MAPPATKSESCRPDPKLFRPRFWPGWLGLGLLWLIHQLPYDIQLAVGRLLGRFFGKTIRSRARIARRNIALCFDELEKEEQESLLKEHFEAIGMSMVETAMTWWGSDKRILSLAEIHGIEHLHKALDDGRGVILLTGHLTSMELAAHIMGLQGRTGAMYRPMKNALMEYTIKNARGRHLTPLLPRDEIRTMTSALREGRAIWYGFDQNYGGNHSLFVPFFGVPASTITTTSRFAKMGNAVVIPFFPYRTDKGRYRIEVHPPLDNFPSGDLEADTRRLNELLEEAIRKAPEQYLWIHRRFKTRPPGDDPVY
ncbi:MAG: LpxL/LpxP family Kdo(2)-lipid IV(A) lauroyl/palmitoleoyl acyltransferase [Sedimenticola sp.]